MQKIKFSMMTLCGAALLSTGCVMPDQIAQLRKDVADVQTQLRRVEQQQEDSRRAMSELRTQLSEETGGVSRAEFADMKLAVDEAARSSAIVDERIRETNQRVDRISQTMQEVRQMARQPVTSGSGYDYAGGRPAGAPIGGDQPRTGGNDRAPAYGAGDALPSPEALYNAAYADYSKGNYSLAVSGFEEYASRFSDSDLADNALYWVGECHFAQGRFDRSVQAFDSLLERYPQSDRAAASNLKKGLAYLEQNQIGKAIVQLRFVLDTYEGSDEAQIARDKLASLGASV